MALLNFSFAVQSQYLHLYLRRGTYCTNQFCTKAKWYEIRVDFLLMKSIVRWNIDDQKTLLRLRHVSLVNCIKYFQCFPRIVPFDAPIWSKENPSNSFHFYFLFNGRKKTFTPLYNVLNSSRIETFSLKGWKMWKRFPPKCSCSTWYVYAFAVVWHMYINLNR